MTSLAPPIDAEEMLQEALARHYGGVALSAKESRLNCDGVDLDVHVLLDVSWWGSQHETIIYRVTLRMPVAGAYAYTSDIYATGGGAKHISPGEALAEGIADGMQRVRDDCPYFAAAKSAINQAAQLSISIPSGIPSARKSSL